MGPPRTLSGVGERAHPGGLIFPLSAVPPLVARPSRSRPPRKKKNQGEGGITKLCALQRNRVHIWFPRIGTGERRQEGDSGWWLSWPCVAILMQLDYAPTPGLYGRRQEKRPNQAKFPVMRLHITHPAWSKRPPFRSRAANHLDALRANARMETDCSAGLSVSRFPTPPGVYLLVCSATSARLTAIVGVANRLGFSGHAGFTCVQITTGFGLRWALHCCAFWQGL